MRICKLICFQLTVPLQLFNHMVSQQWNGIILVQLTGRSFCPIIGRMLSYKKIAMTFFVSDPRPFCCKLFSPGILFVSCLVAPGPLVPQKPLSSVSAIVDHHWIRGSGQPQVICGATSAIGDQGSISSIWDALGLVICCTNARQIRSPRVSLALSVRRGGDSGDATWRKNDTSAKMWHFPPDGGKTTRQQLCVCDRRLGNTV